MYNVSSAYRTAIAGSSIKNRVSGTITLSNNTVINISDSNIIDGSLSINNKAVNNSEFCLGCVYVGEMSLTLYSTTISRYSLYGATVELSYYLNLGNNTEEEVPLGVWYIEKAQRNKKLIQLTCYDAMTMFDTSIEEDSWGTAYELLDFTCENVGVTLANTEEEIEAMPNGEVLLSLNSSRISTYRDFISYVSAVLCGYATINRDGELEIRNFHTTSDLTIGAGRRTDSTVHDYETYFNSVTARFIAEENYYPYTETDPERATGLQLNLGDIPIVQGFEETKHAVLQAILAELEEIRYTPSEVSIVADPSIDLGDCLTLEDVNGTTDDATIIVTGFTWQNHSAEKITCNGKDALLENIEDSTQRQIDGIDSKIESKNLIIKKYTNPDNLTVNAVDTTIINMNWSAFEDTNAIFMTTIPVTMSADGNLVLTCYKSLNSVFQCKKYLSKGEHIVTFCTYVFSPVAEQINWSVKAKTEFYQSDSRVQNAKILSIYDWVDEHDINASITERTVDTTVPSASVVAQQIKAVVFAQGLNATAGWSGTIEIQEEVGEITFSLPIDAVTDSVTSAIGSPTESDLSDTVGEIIFALPIDTITEGGIIID